MRQTSTAPASDSFTLEIVAASLQAAADEMFAALRKTAMSAIIYEVLDAGTAVTAANGDLASSGAGIPSFAGVLDKAVKRILELHPKPEPGDVFATNDPFFGGVTHLNDVVLARTVFVERRLVAWTAAIAHWNDVGGMAPGSISAEATEIFQEGLRLPAVKVVEGGEEVAPATAIHAREQPAAGLSHRRPVRRHRLRPPRGAPDRGARRALRHRHVHRCARASPRPGRAGRPARARWSPARDVLAHVSVELSPVSMVVDLRGDPDQDSGPANVSRDGAVIAAQMALMNLVGGPPPPTPATSGL